MVHFGCLCSLSMLTNAFFSSEREGQREKIFKGID